MAARPFAGLNTRPSPWGYNWTSENNTSNDYHCSPNNSSHGSPSTNTSTSSPEPQMLANQYVNMPAALLTSMKKEKKPFTYTPGGVNLSEVLNARLQKRMERKKKYSEQMMANDNELPRFESPKQVMVMPTYNSPLDMYSMENAIEALEVQAGLVAADKSLSSPGRSATLPRNHTFKFDDLEPNKGVSQSKAFKVLQIITDTDDDGQVKGKSQFHDEMRFTGIRDSKTIPSKFFQTLQKITGTEDDDEQENVPSVNNKHEVSNSAVFVKQSTRSGVQAQQQNPAPPMQNSVQAFQNSNPGLKRPAAFLPMKSGGDPLSRVKPVHLPFLNSNSRKVFNQSGGTDF